MVDNVSPEKRSNIMRGSRAKDTKPEMLVRSWLHAQGYRFRKNRKDLPGKPDIVMPRYKLVVFVHGCFWHQHGCQLSNKPASNADFWEKKFDRNKERDQENLEACKELGWKAHTIWECQVTDGSFTDALERTLQTEKN